MGLVKMKNTHPGRLFIAHQYHVLRFFAHPAGCAAEHCPQNIVRRTYAAEILFGLLMLILSSSWILTFMEEGIATYKDALWYCFALVTTIGFGDITAVTDLGRTISVVLGIYGIIVVALITSIIVNFYGEIKKTRPGEETEAENADPE